MYRAIIFAGTTEGRNIAEFLGDGRVETLVSVATEYGSSLLCDSEYVHVSTGRLGPEEMKELFRREEPEVVIDATHPYATQVTANIKQAAEAAGTDVIRVIRQGLGQGQVGVVYAETTEEAVGYLENTEGNILLTTGSKELGKFRAMSDFRERLIVRVLPSEESLRLCHEAGIEKKNVVCMQGPFSEEINAATLRQFDCRYLVTKLTGPEGGYFEKIDAASRCGATAVVVGVPSEEEGLSYYECIRALCSRLDIATDRYVTLVGIGMGTEETLTMEGAQAIDEAELVIGAG
ncbi:MAG: precorrin-6A reductase, partial [Firmicutes bacterium]|nr:precorrin-6A reductase [Bacillota bacterium]